MDEVSQTLKERNKRYGSFEEMAGTLKKLKDVIRASPNWHLLSAAQQSALDEISMKIARILHGDPNYKDNWHDVEGYAKLISDTLGDE